MMKSTKLFLVGCVLVLTACSCSKDDDIAGQGSDKPKTEKGYATGKAVDTQGKPIAGAYLYLQNTMFTNSYINTTTDENGFYKVPVTIGTWKVHASFKKEYNGKTYNLRLHTDNTKPFSDEGAVRNATWKLEGRDPDPSYNNAVFYGGRVEISYHHNFLFEEQEKVELTFTPDGLLIDGSLGKTLVLTYGNHYWPKSTNRIEDIPIGRYSVTAVLKGAGGDKALRVRDWNKQDDTYVSNFQLDFTPDEHASFNPITEASIVIGY